MNKKFETLKNQLGTGLKGQLIVSKVDDFCNEVWFDESKFEKSSVWTIAGYADGDLKIPLGEGEFDGFLWRNGATYVNFHRGILPCLFPLEYLTKPIRVEGFNAGEEFIFTELWEVGDDDCFMSVDFGNGNTRLISDLETIAKRDIQHDIKYLPSVVVKLMEFLHFNTEGLDSSEFIDASISKVYEPK